MNQTKSPFLVATGRTIIKKYILPGLLFVALVSCSSQPAVSTSIPPSIAATTTHVDTPILATDTPDYPTHLPVDEIPQVKECPDGRVCITWFVGFGIGTAPELMAAEQAIVADFNASQDKITLVIEGSPFFEFDGLTTQIARGNGPDIVGPLGWDTIHALHGQWADLSPLMAANDFDTSVFHPNLLASYQTSQGQMALPVEVYPSAIFYNTALFDKAGLEYPPSEYGPNLSPATYRLDGRELEWNWDTVREVSRRLTLDANGRNATQAGFDRNEIVQYGFSWNFLAQPAYTGTYWGNGSYSPDGKTAQIPDAWKASWKWTYEGIWGDQPFIPNGHVSSSADFGEGNPFNSGKASMTDQPAWYTCCLDGDNKTWDIGVLPAYQGKVTGHVDADIFGILKGTKYPDEAFRALAYLLTTASQELAPLYSPSAIPIRTEDHDDWLEARKVKFPWVRHWEVFITNLNFPDSSSAQGWMPNYYEAWGRDAAFYKRLAETDGLDIEAEIALFQADLQAIFDRAR